MAITTTTATDIANTSSQSSTATAFRIPGTFSPDWLSDDCTTCCMLCEEKFSLIKRRHHCRSCGQIFCSKCCRTKAKLLYLNNEEARICANCARLLNLMLPKPGDLATNHTSSTSSTQSRGNDSLTSSNQINTSHPSQPSSSSSNVQGVLRNSNERRQTRRALRNQTDSNSSTSQQTSTKRVSFPDGIEPGTDLSETSTKVVATSLPRRLANSNSNYSKLKINRSINKSATSGKFSTITVFDEFGFLPPLVKPKISELTMMTSKATWENITQNSSNIVNFKDISKVLEEDGSFIFILLQEFNLKVRVIKLKNYAKLETKEHGTLDRDDSAKATTAQEGIECWCFVSEGLRRLGQRELLMVLAKDSEDECIPRDVFQIYLMTHELALRGQSLHDLGSLIFKSGLFGDSTSAGVLFVDPSDLKHLEDVITAPPKSFLVSILLKRSEIPWAKIFPKRLYYRYGYEYGTYPCAFINYRQRSPLFFEVGHSIISILGDFRNYLYSLTHIEGMRVCYNRKNRKVFVSFPRSSYTSINKVLDKLSNEHVLAWSSSTVQEADGHLIAVQNEEGGYDSVEFIKDNNCESTSLDILESSYDGEDEGDNTSNQTTQDAVDRLIGTSFVTFSGALKVNQTHQKAKVSIVEDGLLIQVQSCTLVALKNSIHYMEQFEIDCGETEDPLAKVTVTWFDDEFE